MQKKIWVLSVSAFLSSGAVYAASAAISSANNQAYIDGQFGYDRLTYSRNHPGDAGAPLYNAKGGMGATQVGLTKTFDKIYTQLALGSTRTSISYSDSSAANLSMGNAVTLSLDGRLGYSFFLNDQIAVTPYLLGGYMQNQLDTGGYSSSFVAGYYGGTTLITQSIYYGIGVLNQWAVTPAWVLSADLQLGSQINPWVNGNVNNFNNQASATTTYQDWGLSPALFWQIGVGSDYRFATNLHFRADLAYGQRKLGGANTISIGIFPSQTHAYWLGSLGLGYGFADFNIVANDEIGGGQEAIHAASNQGSLLLGLQSQNFSGGTTTFQHKQSGAIPALGIVVNKTWYGLYTEVGATEAFGSVSSNNNTTHDAAFDAFGKLGYQFVSSQNTAVTPYGTLGYHRGSQAIQGAASNIGAINNISQTYYVDGVTETYQHSWYGVGLLAQWTPLPRWVLSADGNIGRTFNANMRSWMPLGLPANTSYSLGNANYQMVSLGIDYLLKKNLHAQTNLTYWNYTYNPSDMNAFGISTITNRAHQFSLNIGLGYSFA